MARPVLYKFSTAARHQGREIYEIEVRPPTMRDLKQIAKEGDATARLAKMIELLTGMTTREVEDIQVEDVAALGEIVAGFFPNSKPAEKP